MEKNQDSNENISEVDKPILNNVVIESSESGSSSEVQSEGEEEEVSVLSNYAEDEAGSEEVQSDAVLGGELSTPETLTPTFKSSSPYPFLLGPKGRSKVNLAKGKRPRIATIKTLDDIDGDMIDDLESSKPNNHKSLYRLARESQREEIKRRAKNTLLARIQEMHEKNLITLSECVKIFMREFVPISLSIPTLLSEHALSDILKIEPDSSFIQLLAESRDLQELMRRTILETKNLNLCCCGYVFVHPFLTYTKHPTNSKILISKQPYTDKLGSVKKSDVIAKINALRYYLEIMYECYNN